jgi:hypothetical protein
MDAGSDDVPVLIVMRVPPPQTTLDDTVNYTKFRRRDFETYKILPLTFQLCWLSFLLSPCCTASPPLLVVYPPNQLQEDLIPQIWPPKLQRVIHPTAKGALPNMLLNKA